MVTRRLIHTPWVLFLSAMTAGMAGAQTKSPLGGTVPAGAKASIVDFKYDVQRMRAFELALWSLPAVEIYGFKRAIESIGGGPNTVAAWSKTAGPNAELLTANNVTPYILAFTDLRKGPVVVKVPAKTAKASLYGQIVSHWQFAITDVGPIGADEGKGGKYLLLPPGYEGNVPDGYLVFRSPSYRVYFAFRSIRGQDASVVDAYDYAKTLEMYYLDDPKPTQFIDPSDMRFPSLARFDERWFQDVYEIFSIENVQEQDKIMMGFLATLGIEKGKPFAPDEKTAKAMRQGVVDAYFYLRHRLTHQPKDKYYWPDRHWQNVLTPDENGLFSFVYDDRIDVDNRAERYFIGTYYPRGLFKQPASMYLFAVVDANGDPLRGDRSYELTVPADVPVNQFWSLIIYDQDTMAFIYSDRQGISSFEADTLKKNPDGSITLYFGPDAPERLESNWIPTNGKPPMPTMRFYGPAKTFLDKSWKMPDVVPVP